MCHPDTLTKELQKTSDWYSKKYRTEAQVVMWYDEVGLIGDYTLKRCFKAHRNTSRSVFPSPNDILRLAEQMPAPQEKNNPVTRDDECVGCNNGPTPKNGSPCSDCAHPNRVYRGISQWKTKRQREGTWKESFSILDRVLTEGVGRRLGVEV